MIFTNSLTGLLCSATAAGVKAQLAKCKHEDMPRAPCSNALCILSSQHSTIYGARRLCPSNRRRRPPKLSYVPTRWGPHRATTAAATPARKSLHLDSSNDGHHSSYWAWTKIGIQKAICGPQIFGLFGQVRAGARYWTTCLVCRRQSRSGSDAVSLKRALSFIKLRLRHDLVLNKIYYVLTLGCLLHDFIFLL